MALRTASRSNMFCLRAPPTRLKRCQSPPSSHGLSWTFTSEITLSTSSTPLQTRPCNSTISPIGGCPARIWTVKSTLPWASSKTPLSPSSSTRYPCRQTPSASAGRSLVIWVAALQSPGYLLCLNLSIMVARKKNRFIPI